MAQYSRARQCRRRCGVSANRAPLAGPAVCDPLLTVQQTADRLSASVRTVRRRIADGSLRAVRFGPTQIRIRESAVEALLRPIPSAVTRRPGDAG